MPIQKLQKYSLCFYGHCYEAPLYLGVVFKLTIYDHIHRQFGYWDNPTYTPIIVKFWSITHTGHSWTRSRWRPYNICIRIQGFLDFSKRNTLLNQIIHVQSRQERNTSWWILISIPNNWTLLNEKRRNRFIDITTKYTTHMCAGCSET